MGFATSIWESCVLAPKVHDIHHGLLVPNVSIAQGLDFAAFDVFLTSVVFLSEQLYFHVKNVLLNTKMKPINLNQ